VKLWRLLDVCVEQDTSNWDGAKQAKEQRIQKKKKKKKVRNHKMPPQTVSLAAGSKIKVSYPESNNLQRGIVFW